jgi:hypothetical protein
VFTHTLPLDFAAAISEAEADGPPVTLLEPFDCDLVALAGVELVLPVELLLEDIPLDGEDAAGLLLLMLPEFELPVEPDADGDELILLSDFRLLRLFLVVVVSVVDAPLLLGVVVDCVVLSVLEDEDEDVCPASAVSDFLCFLDFLPEVSSVAAAPEVEVAFDESPAAA